MPARPPYDLRRLARLVGEPEPDAPPGIEPILHVSAVASMIGMNPRTFRKMWIRGAGPHVFKIGRRYYSLESDVVAWIKEHRGVAPSTPTDDGH